MSPEALIPDVLLAVRELSKRFAGTPGPVVDALDFEVCRGEIFALLGPSGCGKTTTLRLIAGFERPDRGQVILAGNDITAAPPERRGIGIVFQDYALFPHLSVLDNVAFALRGRPRKIRRQQALKWLEFVGLADCAKRLPHALSGGQQQRVALARTLAAEPGIVLLDEPFSNLDTALREATRMELRGLLKAAGTSAILVTHDQSEALSVADRIALMRHGSIEQIGTPEAVYRTPRTRFAAEFLGNTNLITGEAAGPVATTVLGPVRLNERAAGTVILSLRPEHLNLADGRGHPAAATVLAREFRGHDLFYRLDLSGQTLLALTDYRVVFEPGDPVLVSPREPAVVLRRLKEDAGGAAEGSHQARAAE
ncbi:MAG: ABC transporter ATP-binding protein [Rhodospirillales bacterium]|nr:MAG: ABC transporter ATP-binding protein [Rhodospirillales bacterium]